MAVKKEIIIINERGCFACQAYIERATVLYDSPAICTIMGGVK